MRSFLIISALTAMSLSTGCGGRRSTEQRRAAEVLADLEGDAAKLPGASTAETAAGVAVIGDGAVGEPALQLYVVLLPSADAFQAPADKQAMWRAVRGEDPRFAAIYGQVGAIDDYALDMTLDFADLPHPQVSMKRIGRLLGGLPPAMAAKGKEAALAVFFQSRSPVLPRGGHVRLVGSAPLYVAERWGGVVVDLIGRRAWTPQGWRAELSRPGLSPAQLKLIDQRDPEGGRWLLTRGHPKLGLPDVQARRVPEGAVEATRRRLLSLQQALLAGDAARAGERLGPCEAPKGFHDGPCSQIAP